MIDVVTDIEIRCPRKSVSEFAADPDNAPAWYLNIKSVEWETPKPLHIGSKVAFKAQFLGRKLAYIYEFIEFIPQVKMVMRTSEGPFPMETTYTWESVDDSTTRMTLRNRGTPSGFSKLLTPFMKSMIRRANLKDLARLKKLLERK
jgi:hypothetical protein